jgi:hypothetical protein
VIGYPWGRPPGSYLFEAGEVQELDPADGSGQAVASYVDPDGGRAPRIPLLAYGANGSPERLALKFQSLPDGHHDALVVAGWLHGFDVGATAAPPVWSAMPGTLFASPGTAVRVAVLFVTTLQFEALAWTELSYRLGRLEDVDITADLPGVAIPSAHAFVSRWGSFCVDGGPIAMAAVPADGRQAPALTQAEILDAAARLTLGDSARAIDVVRAAFEEPAAFMAEHYEKFRSASAAFDSARLMCRWATSRPT